MANNITNVNQSGTPVSKVDLVAGKHTTTIVVAILFTLVLIALMTLICIKQNPPENVVTGLVGLLGVLAGFFAGSAVKGDAY